MARLTLQNAGSLGLKELTWDDVDQTVNLGSNNKPGM